MEDLSPSRRKIRSLDELTLSMFLVCIRFATNDYFVCAIDCVSVFLLSIDKCFLKFHATRVSSDRARSSVTKEWLDFITVGLNVIMRV